MEAAALTIIDIGSVAALKGPGADESFINIDEHLQKSPLPRICRRRKLVGAALSSLCVNVTDGFRVPGQDESGTQIKG